MAIRSFEQTELNIQGRAKGRHRCVRQRPVVQAVHNQIQHVQPRCCTALFKNHNFLPSQRVWECSNVFCLCAPSANAGGAATLITDCVHKQLERTPEAQIFTLGDFNHCKLEFSIPGFSQYVKNDTRKGKTLDKSYRNIPGAYTAKIKSPIATSDHDTVHLIPTY